MAKPKLTNDDFCRAAKRLRCDVAAIKAVAEVESRGEGFYSDGFPVILFERHKFRKYTGGRYNETHPQISGPAGGYGSAGQNQRNKFNLAFKLDPEAAMKSCSWGKFQIMGFNHRAAGFATVGEFVDAMKESEGRQLEAFVTFIIHEHLDDELRGRKWSELAFAYNGPGYEKNEYDSKMAAAYKRFAKEEIDCSQVSAVVPSTSPSEQQPVLRSDATQTPSPTVEQPPIIEQKTIESTTAGGTTVASETTVSQPKGDPPDADATKVSKNGPLAKWLFGSGGMLSIATGLWGMLSTNLTSGGAIVVVSVAIIVIGLLIFAIIFRGAITDAIRMQSAADPDKKNVT
ncbi:MAG TPA: N-acetylmuramidase family protein [Pyrinomonadaceae bacterium]|nr:N-acetylmuramidase family protein [Pyrinomonadaceae bacterium]